MTNANTINSNTMDALTLEKILKERANKIKVAEVADDLSGDFIEGLEFELNSESYIIDSCCVLEVLPLMEVTALPGTPDFVLGIFNYRGFILALINVRFFLNLQNTEVLINCSVIILKYKGIELGILVDKIIGTKKVFIEKLQPNLTSLSSDESNMIMGITDQRSIVLDVNKLLMDERLVINDSA